MLNKLTTLTKLRAIVNTENCNEILFSPRGTHPSKNQSLQLLTEYIIIHVYVTYACITQSFCLNFTMLKKYYKSAHILL